MTRRRCLVWAPLLLSLSACRDQEARALQIREAEFRLRETELRLKEACFASGTKFFHEIVEKTGATELTETFYSAKRNSCICETRRQPPTMSGPLTYELYDCLSLERLGDTSVPGSSSVAFGSTNPYQRGQDERQQKKDALK